MPKGFDPKTDNIAIPQLVQLHAQIGAKLKACDAERLKFTNDMRQIEAVILLFDPAFNTRGIAIKRRNVGNPWFKRGTLFRAALGILRASIEPLPTLEIARRLVASKGAEPTDEQLTKLDGGLRSCMEHNAGKTVLGDGGRPQRWRLATE